MAWFKKTRKPIESPDKASRVPEGLWVKCPSCAKALYHKDLDETLQVCAHCGHHFRLSAAERLASQIAVSTYNAGRVKRAIPLTQIRGS